MKFKGYTLFPHQIKFLNTVNKRPRYYFAWGVGSGKTFMASMYTGARYLNGKKVLVITTPSLIGEFVANLRKMYNISEQHISILATGPAKQDYLNFPETRKNVAVCSYRTMLNKDIAKAFEVFKFDDMLLDEAHNVKDPKGKTAKAIFNMAFNSKIKRRYLFSGTFMPNSYEDIYMQYKIMDDGETFGLKYDGEFKRRYFEDVNSSWKNKEAYYPKYRLKSGSEQKIMDKLKQTMDYVETKDVAKLPPYILRNVKLTMSDDQVKDYNYVLEKSAIKVSEYLDLYEKKMISKNIFFEHILSVYAKLRQIASGFYMFDQFNPMLNKVETVYRTYEDNSKIKFLKEIIQSRSQQDKIIVWCYYRNNYNMTARALKECGIDHTLLAGGMTYKKRNQAIERFKYDPHCRVLVANPKSGGEGLNLTLARICVYFSYDYNYKDDHQSAGRNYRVGSDIHDNIVRINLISKGTIDEEIRDNINNKHQLVNKVVEYIKRTKGVGHDNRRD